MAPLVATLIVAVTLALVLSDKLNHTIAAAGGAAAMIGAGLVLGFYSEEQALDAMHFGALGLLLGMMILVPSSRPLDSSNTSPSRPASYHEATPGGCFCC